MEEPGSNKDAVTHRGALARGSRSECGVLLCRQHSLELVARADVELGEDLAQVVLDGAAAHGRRAPSDRLGISPRPSGEGCAWRAPRPARDP
jgi:hypothetical protein